MKLVLIATVLLKCASFSLAHPLLRPSPMGLQTKTSRLQQLMEIRGGDDAHHHHPAPLMKTPADTYKSVVAQGTKKASQPTNKIFLLGIMAGLQVGIGAAMAVATLGGIPLIQDQNPGLAKILFGISGLPCALVMVVATGSELFTGNTALVGTAFLEGKVTRKELWRSWSTSYLGNVVGTALLAIICNYAGIFAHTSSTFSAVADAKASLPVGIAIARGLICNWLVTTAVWVSIAAADLVSKAFCILLIITIFASLGFEHSIANMFFGAFGALQKTSRNSYLKFFLKNLVPVTIGNIVGGFLLTGGVQYLTYGSGLSEKKAAAGVQKK